MKNSNRKSSLFILILFFFISFSTAQKPENKPYQPPSSEAYLDYIKSENKAIREQTTLLRQTIEKEREEHYEFVERIYLWTSVLVTVIITLFGSVIYFIGRTSSKKIREDFDRILKNELKQPVLVKKMIQIAKEEASLEKGNFQIIADEKFLDELKKTELPLLKERGINVQFALPNQKIHTNVDVLLYRFNPTLASNTDKPKALNIDLTLEKLMSDLKNKKVPNILVIYVPQPQRLGGSTLQAFSDYPLAHMATNRISLIDNLVSAYRVSRLNNSQQPQA